MKYNCRINKTPFLLWFTKNIELDIDFENNMSIDADGLKSNIKKVNTKFIFFIKYLPVLILFALGIKIPMDIEEGILFFVGGVIAFALQYIFVNYLLNFRT